MAIVEGWYPPTRENWETTVLTFQILYPAVRRARRHDPPLEAGCCILEYSMNDACEES